jgi:hypothetical protein
MSIPTAENLTRWKRLSIPLRIGLGAAALAMLLTLIGIARGNVPLNPLSILLALLIAGGSWGLVAWAVATAAVDVESDVAEAEQGVTSNE